MRVIKLIIKGVLLYVTFLLSFFFLAGVDSIYDNGYFLHFITIIISMCYICYKTISEDAVAAIKILGKEISNLF